MRIQSRLDSDDISAGNEVTLDIPNSHFLAAIDIHLDAIVEVTSGSVTIVDSTLGAIPLITRIQLILDGRTIPLDISGEFLDYWSHIDRPGSERIALSSTTDGDPWDTVLRYELAQSIANLTGAIRLSDYGTVQLKITFGAVTLIATGTGVSVSGTVKLYGDLYDESQPVAADTSVIHTLNAITHDVQSTGINQHVDLAKGRVLERLIVIPENSGSYTWALVDAMSFRKSQGNVSIAKEAPVFRAEQRRYYGGDDSPITGVHVFDFRQAGNRDVLALGGPAARSPQLLFDVGSGTSLSTARLHLISEELEPVEAAA